MAARRESAPSPCGCRRSARRPGVGAGVALGWLVVLALGSATGVEALDRLEISTDELLGGAPLGGGGELPSPVANEEVLAVSPEMREFLAAHVHRKAAESVRFKALVEAIINTADFRLEFEERTRTAAETFRSRKGNCLSFSSLFVAMAREVGLDASFQEVDIPPDWSLQNDVFVLNRHVNVRIRLEPSGDQVVDFNIDDFRASYDTRTISDARALAHYYNNMGVESMQAGDTLSALLNFRKAIADNDRRFSPAWTNLGTLYLRQGHSEHAEAAYQHALRADRKDLVAMSNLARLYERRGEPERAEAYRSKVVDHRRRNPYYRYQRAREAYAAGDYDGAIGHLKVALRRKRTEDQFYGLLGLCHLKLGHERAARRWLARAQAVASTEAQKRTYSKMVDMLR